MRQRRWLKLVKNYHYDFRYHIGKANIMVDTLGRKVVLSHIIICRELQQDLVREQIEMVTRLMLGFQI